jgi:putative flippase GtrA
MIAPLDSVDLMRGVIPSRSAVSLGQQKCKEQAGAAAIRRWLKFNLVGGIGIVVQLLALFLMKKVFHFEYLVATALAVEAAVVHNFVWHEQFTWADREQASWFASLRRLLRFNVAAGGVSMLGNVALMKVLVGYGHMNYLAANGIAIVMCSLANFLVSEHWVFTARD